MIARTTFLLVLAGLTGLAGLAPEARAAGPGAAAVAQAKEEFHKAEVFFRAKDYAKAVEHYRKAYALAKRPKLLYNIGVALRLKGDKQEALEALQAYIAAEPTSKYVAEAQSEIAGLLQEIGAEGPRRPSTSPTEPEPEPPAAPTESATAPPPAPPPATDAHEPTTAPSAPVRDAPRGDGSGVRTAGWVTAGVGVALIATGAVFGLKAKSAKDDLASASTWDPGLYESGTAANRNMFIFLGVGAAAVATGAVLVFVVGRPTHEQTVTLAPAPGGLLVQGRF